MPVVIGALGMVAKGADSCPTQIPGNHKLA